MVHIFKPFYFGKSWVADLSSMLNLFFNINLSIHVLDMQRGKKFLWFRAVSLNLNIWNIKKYFEHLFLFPFYPFKAQQLCSSDNNKKKKSPNNQEKLSFQKLVKFIFGIRLKGSWVSNHLFLDGCTICLQIIFSSDLFILKRLSNLVGSSCACDGIGNNICIIDEGKSKLSIKKGNWSLT